MWGNNKMKQWNQHMNTLGARDCGYGVLIALFIMLLWSVNTQAYQRSYLNFGFESPILTPAAVASGCYVQVNSSAVPGWNATQPSTGGSGSCNSPSAQTGNLIELWTKNFSGFPSREGNQFAELNAEAYSEMQQDICLVTGEPVSWKFSHNGRSGTDGMSFRAGPQQIATMSTTPFGQGNMSSCASGTCNVTSQVVTGSSQTIGSTTDNRYWADYSGTFNYSGATGQTILGFKAVTASSSTVGNFLDGVQISVKPIIEFASANYNTPESGGTPPSIQVIVVGVIPAGGLTLTFNINDVVPPNNAQLGIDYLVNGGANRTFTKSIPAGDYGFGTPYTISIPVAIIDDPDNEPDEQFTVTLQPDTSNFYIFSSSVCGSTGFGTSTYTIVDDDAPQDMNLAISKTQRVGTSGTFTGSPLNVTTGSTMQYQLVVSNPGSQTVSASAVANFNDTIPANLTGLSIVGSPASANGATTCTASLSGNTLSGTFSGPQNATCTLTIQASASTAGSITNTATVSVPAGNNEIIPANNSSSVQATIAAASLVLNKISISGVGTFGYTLSNTVQTTGAVTTSNSGTAVQVDGDNSTAGTQAFAVRNAGTQAAPSVIITESMPAGQSWELSSVSCNTTSGSVSPTLNGNQVTIPMTLVSTGAVVTCNLSNTRLPTVKVQKISQGGTGTFSFSDTNLNGSISNISTSSAGVAAPVTPAVLPVSSRTTDVTITEGAPSGGFVLTDASCVDANYAITGNIGSFGTFNYSSRVLTIPANYLITGGADLSCTFVNTINPQADLVISKTDNATQIINADTTTYMVRVTNNGPIAVTGATLRDPSATSLTKNTISCSSASGNQCAAESTPSVTQIQNSGGYALPRLNSGEFYEVLITATNSASSGSVTNTASVTPPSGVTNTGASCTSSGGIIRSFASNVCTSTDTDTATAGARNLTMQKTWTNGKQFDKATITAITTTGTISLSSVSTGAASQSNSSSMQQVVNATNVTLQEVLDVGNGNYNTAAPTCTAGTVTSNGNGTYNLALPASGSTAITCTYTNVRKQASLQVGKAWINGKTGDVANVPATIGLTNNTTILTRTAPNAGATTSVTVYAGEVATLPAETMSTGNIDNYNVTLSCAVSSGSLTSTLSGTNGKGSNTLSIDAGDEGKTISCTYSNSRLSQQINLSKQWQSAINGHTISAITTGGTNNPAITAVADSTGNNQVSGSLVTVYAGDTLTLPAESFSNGANQNQYDSSVACANGTPLGSGATGRTVTISNNTIATVCTYTNARKSLTFRLAKTWGANSINANVANIAATTGLINNTAAFSSTASTNTTGAGVTAYVGETVTIPAETMSTGNISNYNTVLACKADGGATANVLSGTNGQVSNTLVLGSSDANKVITCTYTNTRKSATFRLAKAWGANSINGNVANIAATTGLINNTAALTSTASTSTTGTGVTVYAGETVTMPAETMSTGNINSYNTVLSCTADGSTTANVLSGTSGQASNTLLIGGGDEGKTVTCIYTNTRKSATFRLAKAWGANSINGNVANIAATTGLINNTAALTSTASTNTTGTGVTVYAGETVTMPAETMSTGNISNYNTVLSCTADSGATASTPSGSNGQGSNTLAIGIGDDGKTITCTYLNTRKSATLTVRKIWSANSKAGDTVTVSSSSFINNATSGSSVATAAGNTSTGTAVTVYAGESGTIGETFSVGSASNYNATLSCTGNSTALSSNSLTINAADTAIICTYTNSRIAQQLTLAKQWQNGASGHTISVTTTGGTNNPTLSSTSTGNNTTTGTAVTVYAGDSVTLPAETFGGGSAAQYNSSLACTGGTTLSSGAVNRSISITNSTTATVCTYVNARKSATLTVRKVWSANSIAGNTTTVSTSGFGNIATTGVSTATAAGNTTTGTAVTVYAGESGTIGETFGVGSASNYNATLSCTGNTNALSGNTLTIDPSDTAIICTETNTRKSATLTVRKVWSANSIAGNTVTVSSSGFANTATTGVSTATAAGNTTTGTAVTVYAGESGTIAETFGAGSASNYNATLSCTGNTNALSGNALTINPSDTAIICTETNTRKSATLTLRKIWVDGIDGNTATVSNSGFTNNATTGVSISTGNNSTTGSSVVVYAGETGTISETFGVGSASNYNAVLSCTGNGNTLSANSLTISPSDTAVVCTYTNNRVQAVVISGRVFTDNSGTTGSASAAYNAVQDAGELGIAGSKIALTNCAATQIATTTTNAAGDYSFSVLPPQLPASSFCVVQTNVSGYSSVSGTSGYNRSTDTITIANSGATSYSTHNFGDVKLGLVLTEDGQKTISAGGVVDYPHRLIASSVLRVSNFNVTATQQPANAADQVWQSVIYRDANCNEQVDAGETRFNPSTTTPVAMLPNQEICLVQRVNAPSNASAGAQHIGRLTASYVAQLLDSSQLSGSSDAHQDTTLIGSAGLTMSKQVRVVASCPSTAADVNPFSVQNQASNGDYLEYEITYRNNSTRNLVDVVIKDSVPLGTSFQSMECKLTPVASCTANHAGDALIWQTTGLLTPAKQGTVRFCTRVQ